MSTFRRRAAGLVAAALVLGTLTVGVTWPLFRHPGTQVLDAPSLYGPASELVQRDINLTLWTLAWDSHALVTQPLHLFHANAFYPARWSLALTEHMLGNVPTFGPVYLATANAVLAHQLTLLATFVIAGLAMASYLHYWTRDRAAALAGGCLFAFAPFRLWQLGNLHVISIHWLPLVLLGVDLTLDGRRRAGGLVLGAALALSSLCSYYVGYATFALGGAYALVRVIARRRDAAAALPALAVGFGGAVAAVAVLTIPYLLLQREGVLPDRTGNADPSSMALLWLAIRGPRAYTAYFVTPLHDGIPQFLGYGVLALAGIGTVLARRAPRGALLAVAVTGWALALGPVLSLGDGREIALPYRWLMDVVPGFSAMRVPQRFGALVTVAATALAGLGLAALRERVTMLRGAGGVALAASAVALALFEAHTGGLQTVPVPVGPSMPAAHRWLAAHGDGGALIEVPVSDTAPLLQSIAMYQSTAHWLPLANGYAAYVPATFTAMMTAAAELPDPGALDRLLAVAPLRWVLVRWRLVGAAQQPTWRTTFAAAGLTVAGEFDEMTLFEVPPDRRAPAPPADRAT